MKRLHAWLASLVTATSLLIIVDAPQARASDCDTFEETSVVTTKGSAVWIPSSRSAGPFQWGGSQSISIADGQLNASTQGKTRTLGGSGGINVGIYKAEAKYEQQWSRSTTVTNSFTKTFTTNSGNMPRDVHWRWRMYVPGYMFKVTRTVENPSPCSNWKVYWITKKVVVPTSKQIYSFDVETYATRERLHNASGDPIRF